MIGVIEKEVKHFHVFGAIGGGAKGFNRGKARVGNMTAKFRCIGSIDVDAAANRDFLRMVGVPATTMDLFDRSQYVAFHGKQPPNDWREAIPVDIRHAAGNESPNIIFLSAPCKGFSGLLAEGKSKTDKYQALNRLTLRGIWLALEAFADDPAELIVFENVPRIANRGRYLLDQIVQLLQQYGYAVAETTHDCGELGGLAQSRKRFLLVARHREKVPPFLYEPEKKTLKSVGSVLERMPLPGDPRSGPMHRIPSLQWKTWVRLAFVEAGSDWRSLNKLNIEDGYLSDFMIVPEAHRGFLGVREWDKSMGCVTSRGTPTCGAFSIADPRTSMRRGKGDSYLTGGHYGVVPWESFSGAVSSSASLDNGRWSVADPRLCLDCGPNMDSCRYPDCNYAQFTQPAADQKLIARITSLDGTWHRPFTTLELAALQSLIEPEEYFEMDGLSDGNWRERIGNAVPPAAAEAIAGVMGVTLLLAWSGETFVLSSLPIWVQPVAVALSVSQQHTEGS